MNDTITNTCLEIESLTSNNECQPEMHDPNASSTSISQSFFLTDKLLLLINVETIKGCRIKLRKTKRKKPTNEIRTMILKSLGQFRSEVVSVVS